MVALGACRAQIHPPPPGDDCDVLIASDVTSATDGQRTVGEVLSFVREEWLALSVTWDDGSRSTVDVTIAIGEATEALLLNTGCEDEAVLVRGLEASLQLDDDQAVLRAAPSLSFGVGYTEVSVRSTHYFTAEEELEGAFAELDPETLTLQWFMSDSEPDKLILGDAGGEVFVCDESVHGDCLQPR